MFDDNFIALHGVLLMVKNMTHSSLFLYQENETIADCDCGYEQY
jgi:hypothetical protein